MTAPEYRVITIGVYGFDGETFIQRLQQANVRLLLDVRQRRGVRESQYAWANSLRLQATLAHAGMLINTLLSLHHHRATPAPVR